MNGIPDIEMEMFEGCREAVLAVDSTIVCGNAFESHENNLPFVHIIEDRNVVFGPTAGNDELENHAFLRYSVNVYTDDASGKKARAKAIMAAACTYFDSVGFVRTRCQPMAGTGGIYRILACFEAVMGKDKRLYAPVYPEGLPKGG